MNRGSLYDRVRSSAVHTEVDDDGRATHETARRLIRAARTILTRDGFERLTLEAVSSEAGMNKAATRYHFGNKEGLINAVMAEIVLDECADLRPPDELMTRAERAGAIIENVRSISLNPSSFSGFFELLPQASKNDTIHRHFVTLYERWFDSNLDWLDLRDRDMPAEAKQGLTMLLAAIIDGLAVQQTIFGNHNGHQAVLNVLRVIVEDLIPETPASE